MRRRFGRAQALEVGSSRRRVGAARAVGPRRGSAPTDVVETGRPRLVLDLAKYRPVRGGCAIVAGGHGGAGTLGGFAYDPNQGFTVVPAGITCRHCLFLPSFFPPKTPTYIAQGGDPNAIGTAHDRAPMSFGQDEKTAPLNTVDAGKTSLGLS